MTQVSVARSPDPSDAILVGTVASPWSTLMRGGQPARTGPQARADRHIFQGQGGSRGALASRQSLARKGTEGSRAGAVMTRPPDQTLVSAGDCDQS